MELLFIMLLLLGALCLTQQSSNQGGFYRLFQISRSRLSSGARTNDIVTFPLLRSNLWKFPCSKACSQFDWCNLWCPDLSSSSTTNATTTCLLFQMYVSYGYQETNTADVIDCYTSNVKDYVPGASIEASQVNPLTPVRVKSNLIDGIHDFDNINQCFASAGHYNPYFKLDLGSAKKIRRVMFLLQNNRHAQYYVDYKILIGIKDYPEDEFSKYQLFGYFPGPSSSSMEVSFSYPDPVLARYVVVQRMSDASCNPDGSTIITICRLQVCHIEIN